MDPTNPKQVDQTELDAWEESRQERETAEAEFRFWELTYMAAVGSAREHSEPLAWATMAVRDWKTKRTELRLAEPYPEAPRLGQFVGIQTKP